METRLKKIEQIYGGEICFGKFPACDKCSLFPPFSLLFFHCLLDFSSPDERRKGKRGTLGCDCDRVDDGKYGK